MAKSPVAMKALSIRQPWAYAIFHMGKSVMPRSAMRTFRGQPSVTFYSSVQYKRPLGWQSKGLCLNSWDR